MSLAPFKLVNFEVEPLFMSWLTWTLILLFMLPHVDQMIACTSSPATGWDESHELCVGFASIHDSPDPHISISWDYKHEAPCPVLFPSW
jgi:hypothetical protein